MFAIANLALRLIGLFISTKYVLEWFFDARDYFRRDTTGDLLRGESDIVRIFLKGGTVCKTTNINFCYGFGNFKFNKVTAIMTAVRLIPSRCAVALRQYFAFDVDPVFSPVIP